MRHYLVLVPSIILMTAPAVAALPTPGDSAQPVARLSLQECLEASLERHPDVLGARLATRQQQAEADKVGAALLPKLSVSASVQLWNDDATVELLPSGSSAAAPPDPESDFDGWVGEQLGALASLGAEPITLRDQVTGDVTVQVVQPLTVGPIVQGSRAADALTDGARAHERTVGQNRALAVATAYYSALQAQAFLEIADTSVTQLGRHHARVLELAKEGVLARNDVLKVEVQLARARQARIQATSAVTVSRAALAVEIGRDSAQPVAPAPPVEGAALPPDSAELARPELDELEHRTRAAKLGASAAWWQLAPTVALMGRYSHTEGQGGLAIQDSAFVGLALEWDVWDWGARSDAAEAADLAAERATVASDQVERQLGLQLVDRRERVDAASQALAVATVAVTQAQEALRIEEERLGEEVATATDVLDAQAALTRARGDEANAYYQKLLAGEALRHALGLPLGGGER